LCDKFIIVGDVNQLSPYTDPFMLETLLKSNPKVDSRFELLAYNNYVLNKLTTYCKNRYMVVLNIGSSIIELSEWFKDSPQYDFVHEDQHLGLLFGGKSIVISRNKYLEWLPIIPKTYIEIFTIDELPDYLKLKYPNTIKAFSDKVETLREQSDSEINSNWGKEVAWRYVRYHELNKNNAQYEQDLSWLLPSQLNSIRNEIEEISDITIPSVLVKLQNGVKSKNQMGLNTRFRKGFSEQEKESRFVQLKYQHRMHSSISKYAENSIYIDLLKTGSKVDSKRNDLPLFSDHNIFVDVRCEKLCKQQNEKEAIEISRILKVIIERSKTFGRVINVGVLTFYKAQESLVKKYVNDMLLQYNTVIFNALQIEHIHLEIYTVDKFQGKESDISIISLSRNKGLGFMNVPNRINVAMTRAKYYRVVVGDGNHFRSLDQPFLKNIYLDSVAYPEGALK